MKIGIDARFLLHPQYGGFKTYTESLITALGHIDRQNRYVLYVDRWAGSNAIRVGSNFEVRRVLGDVPFIGMVWREQVLLPYWAWHDQLDLFHSPCLSAPLRMPCPLVVTVHDLIWHRSYSRSTCGSRRQRMLRQYYSNIVPRAVRRAAATLTVSEVSKSEITRLLGIPEDRIYVTYEAARPSFRPVEDALLREAVRTKYDLPVSYIMAIGAADPRKNLATLVEAYRLIPETVRKQYPLVLMWSHSALARSITERVENQGLSGQVLSRRLDATNQELAALYSMSSLFIFPSIYEGFGLPPLEAMACGVPVVAGNNSSMPEVLGDAACYASADDPADMAGAISCVLTDERTRVALSHRGLVRAGEFSWEACARQTLAAYERVGAPLRPESATKRDRPVNPSSKMPLSAPHSLR